jgi:hypothetical protein
MGLQLPMPEYMPIDRNLDNLTPQLAALAAKGKQFVLYIDNKANPSHGTLKFEEKHLTILTQHVTVEAVRKSGPQTMANIINKMNMKLAFNKGLNCIPIMEPQA